MKGLKANPDVSKMAHNGAWISYNTDGQDGTSVYPPGHSLRGMLM